jgi:hypothetical protein
MKEVTSITIPNGIEISVDFRTAAWLSVNNLDQQQAFSLFLSLIPYPGNI